MSPTAAKMVESWLHLAGLLISNASVHKCLKRVVCSDTAGQALSAKELLTPIPTTIDDVTVHPLHYCCEPAGLVISQPDPGNATTCWGDAAAQ